MSINLYNEDCLNFLPKLENNSVDLTVTSPPYNCGIDYNTYNDNKPWEQYLQWCQNWINQLYRVSKEDGRIAINVLVQMGIEKNTKRVSPLRVFSDMIEKAGFNIMGLPMWVDNHRIKYTAWGSWKSASSPYIYNPYQVIILAYKNHKKKLNKGISTVTKEDFMNGCCGIWQIRPDTNSLTKATFPIALPKLCIDLLTYQEDLVLDPFCGSGTTAVACLKTKRNFIGCEIDTDYYNIALDRIEKNRIVQQEIFC